MAEVVVAARFNGPRESGNGGYSAGVIAALLDGPVSVSLRRPVPLDTPLQALADATSVRLRDGEDLIAEGELAPGFEIELPDPVDVEVARGASRGYRGRGDGPFSHCFVCGRARDDSLGVFAGPVDGRDLVATPWTPPAWTADESGTVRPEFLWAVLDCPTYFAAYRDEEETVSFLAQMTARVDAPAAVGEEHVVIGWPIAIDGRKRQAGSAVLTGEGNALAVAEVLLIEPRAL